MWNCKLEISVNDVIADKNVVTKIMNKSTSLHRIELNGFAKRHWQTCYYPFAYCLDIGSMHLVKRLFIR